MSNELKCPHCESTNILGRKDAYVNYKLTKIPREEGVEYNHKYSQVKWEEKDTAEMDDVVYECFSCNKVIECEELEEFNEVIL